MSLAVFLAMLLSAFLHAGWNAWVKSRRDTNAAIVALVVGAGVPNIAVLAWFGFPAPPAWPWVVATVAFSVLALNLLGAAYRESDFAVAFPMMRGLIPVVLLIAAVPMFGETPAPAGIFGVLLVSGGLCVMAFESARRSRSMTLKGLGLILAAAALTALTVLTDAMGARLSGNAFGYAATIAVLNAVVMGVMQLLRGRDVARMLADNWQVAVFAAGMSIVSYQLFIWSLLQAPVAMVSALRETSMVFALAIAAIVLGERVGLWRGLAVALILGGAVLIRA